MYQKKVSNVLSDKSGRCKSHMGIAICILLFIFASDKSPNCDY
ncbi:hypothetical protein BOVA604_3310 [Bacteroides ovatus]|nr:hypothetical protein BOVA604_3310 [Bacteroides ovatus]